MKKSVLFRSFTAMLVALWLCACAKVSLADQFERFVSNFSGSYESYSYEDWEKSNSKFLSLLSQYEAEYNHMVNSDLDRIDDAISVYNYLSTLSPWELFAKEDLSCVTINGLVFNFSDPEIDGGISQWAMMNKEECAEKIDGLNPNQEYTIPEAMIQEHPCLVYLVLTSKSISEKKEKQDWFDLYPLMNQAQIDKLYDMLYRENCKLGSIERKYRARQYNQEAYDYAKEYDFYHAQESVDKAIELDPDDPNYYDSKGELYLMQDRYDRALAMWNKVLALDPDFLSKYDGHTKLYDGLDSLGMIK